MLFSGFFCQAQDLILADTSLPLSAEDNLLFTEPSFPVIWTKFLSNQAGFPSGEKIPTVLHTHWTCIGVLKWFTMENKAHTRIPRGKDPLARSSIDGPLICLVCFWDVAFFWHFSCLLCHDVKHSDSYIYTSCKSGSVNTRWNLNLDTYSQTVTTVTTQFCPEMQWNWLNLQEFLRILAHKGHCIRSHYFWCFII